ncbi:MAG: type II secretion system F family protein [Thermoplasmatota archaeon]
MAMSFRRTIAALDMSPGRYVAFYAIPIVLMGVAFVVILRLIAPWLFTSLFGYLFYAVPAFFLVLAALYPRTRAEGRRHEIDRNIHFFVTHMGVLATSQIPRVEVLRILGEKKQDYGVLADEAAKIHTLVESWHMSLAESCRFVSRRTPSELFSDFLDRFAYALDSGEDLEGFLKNEQIVLMEEFLALYRRNLYGLESLKNLFNALIMSIIFIVIFAVLMPIILGLDATMLMGSTLFLVAFIEIGFVYYAKQRAPSDPIWHSLPMDTPLKRNLRIALPLAFGAVFALLFSLLFLTHIPLPLIVAISVTPLLAVGWLVSREEEMVKRREDNYSAFIRSLGASASARGGAVRDALRHLQHHDFGPLTTNIRNVFQRLSLRVDDDLAWEHFSNETGSNIIAKSNRMFTEGLKAGGKPDQIGQIISDNFVRLIGVRKARYQLASSLRGLLYGLIAGMAFALFVGLAILGMLERIFSHLSVSGGADELLGPIFHFGGSLPTLSALVLMLLLVHALASALMVKVADGGDYQRAYVDFVGFAWVVAVIGLLSDATLGHLLT